MSDETNAQTKDPRAWRDLVLEYAHARRSKRPAPDGHMLAPLPYQQRRVSGGALLQFLEFARSEEAFTRFPILQKDPLTERVFVYVTDEPGAVAFRELAREDDPMVALVFAPEWRAYLDDTTQQHDDTLELHWECWSVWHQTLDPHWMIPEGDWKQLWVHEEGFALADQCGRGSKNLWSWDGTELTLVTQDIEKWVSTPDGDPPSEDELH